MDVRDEKDMRDEKAVRGEEGKKEGEKLPFSSKEDYVRKAEELAMYDSPRALVYATLVVADAIKTLSTNLLMAGGVSLAMGMFSNFDPKKKREKRGKK